MALLIVGLIVFLGVHLLPTLPDVRERLLARFGERGYKGLFDAGSIIGFVLLVWGYSRAPFIPVWDPPVWTRHLAIVLMIPAFILIVAAYRPGRIKQTLKHPFLVGVKLWALAHLLANGDVASIILFVSILAYAVFDRITVKRRGNTGLPNLGPPSARNDVIAIGAGLAVYVAFLFWLHPLLIGVSPLP